MDSKGAACSAESHHLAISEANNHLAVQLYKLLAKEKKNIFFSPFSISTALAMLFCGSALETAEEMRRVLGYEIAKTEDKCIKSYFQHLLSDIESSSDGYTLGCANSVVIDKHFSVKEEFKYLLEQSFKALIREADFKNESDIAVGEINDWVKQKTNGAISKVLDTLNPSSVLVLLNAVYFKGFWLNKFHIEGTWEEKFYNKGFECNAKEVEMMHIEKEFPFVEKESFKAVQLPYKGEDVSMVVLLPNALDGLEELESTLSSTFVKELLEGMRKTDIEVALPKFRLEYYSNSLKNQFKSLGMKRVFDAGADLDGISDSKQLLISEIIHKAVVEVNEEGCEAAAITVEISMAISHPIVPDFIADHPFLFVIYNSKSDLIIFMGRVDEL